MGVLILLRERGRMRLRFCGELDLNVGSFIK